MPIMSSELAIVITLLLLATIYLGINKLLMPLIVRVLMALVPLHEDQEETET